MSGIDEISEIMEKRFRFLRALYEESEADEYKTLHTYPIAGVRGFETKLTDKIVRHLERDGFVESSATGGLICITHKGIREVERVAAMDAHEHGLLVGPVVEELVADTREFVDSNLERLSPKSAAKLAETYTDLVQGDSELKWSQVAYACRDILQDFTDAICDPQFLGVQVQLPPKANTKDKIRAALQARIPKVGKTERKLLESLAQYIDDYFDKLNDFIQKNVHPPRQEQVGSEAAKRCVIYTYLLIADLLSLLL